MCERPITLIFIFLLKIIIIFIVPFILLRDKNNYGLTKYLYIIEIGLIILFSVLLVFNNKCIINSNVRDISKIYKLNQEQNNIINESNSASEVEKIITNKIYKTNSQEDVYYFNNSILPLSDKKFKCDDKELYMKHYGNGITALSMLVSNKVSDNIDPIELLNVLYNEGKIDCNNGINIDDAIDIITQRYGLSYRQIDSNELKDQIYYGNIALAEITYNPEFNKNLTCSKGYIVIYSSDSNYNFQILNPNDNGSDMICPDNTAGSLSIIKGNSNEQVWNIDELNQISTRYIMLEGR